MQSQHSLAPSNVEHLQIVLHNANFLLLVRLVEVLQNDGNVHVDHNHVVDDDEAGEVDDGEEGVPAVAVRLVPVVGIAVGVLDHEGLEHVVPSSRCDQAEEQVHGSAECFEIYHIV